MNIIIPYITFFISVSKQLLFSKDKKINTIFAYTNQIVSQIILVHETEEKLGGTFNKPNETIVWREP